MVPPSSHRIPRARWYSGYCLSFFFTLTGLSPSLVGFPTPFCLVKRTSDSPYPESITTLGLAFSAFARHYSRNLVWFLFLCLLRCFSSAGSPPVTMYSLQDCTAFPVQCFHIRTSPDQCIFAAPRSLSQLVASFFASWCQGIHLMLLLAWTNFWLSLREFRKSFEFFSLSDFAVMISHLP